MSKAELIALLQQQQTPVGDTHIPPPDHDAKPLHPTNDDAADDDADKSSPEDEDGEGETGGKNETKTDRNGQELDPDDPRRTRPPRKK